MNASIGGLVSGLDTATIISQLMQLEARPQANLKSRVSTEQRAVNALQTLNSKLAGIATKAADLAQLASWSPMKATSDNEKASVSAQPTATLSTLTFEIVRTATASQTIYSSQLEASAAATAADTLSVTYADGRAAASLSLTDKSLRGVADAINADTTLGLKATLVRAGGTDTAPTYQLHLVSASTGDDSGFAIDDGTGTFMGSVASQTPGVDAKITINGQALTSSTNTFDELMPGVDVSLAAGATGSATITIGRDSASLTGKVKAMVDAVNSALGELSSLTASGAEARSRGMLAGDSLLRTVRNQLIEAVTGGVGGESLAAYGIQTDRSGKLVFDAEKFKTAYEADPTKTADMFATPTDTTRRDGLAATLQSLSKVFSDSIDGTVTTAIKSRQSTIKGWEDHIADWDVRLAARQNALQRQYTALESALGKLQSQGSWLAGQLASLPRMSSGQ